MLQRPGLGPAQCLRAGSDLGGGPDAYDTRWVEAVNVTQRSLGVRSGLLSPAAGAKYKLRYHLRRMPWHVL